MKKNRAYKIVLICLMAISCVQVGTSYAAKHAPEGYCGGDGKSFEEAIIIPYIGDYEKSIDREYSYISAIFGVRDVDWAFIGQEFIEKDGKFYDRITIKITFSREKFPIYFDITEPYNALQKHLGR